MSKPRSVHARGRGANAMRATPPRAPRALRRRSPARRTIIYRHDRAGNPRPPEPPAQATRQPVRRTVPLPVG